MIESSEARRTERRYQAGRPYYRPANRQKVSNREDQIFGAIMAVVVGAMIGATITLMVVS